MKKSIYKILSETFKKTNKWNYYNPLFDFGKELPFISEQSSIDFLKNFIKVAGKAEQKLFNEIDNLGNRANHTVTVFFLGHYIYQNTILKHEIDKEISNLKDYYSVNCIIEFSYLWFLTCLFHDLGYKIENNKVLQYDDFNSLIINSKNLFEVSGVPQLYGDIYKEYFKYRLKKHCKNDHGIVAAHLLFDSLCEIRRLAKDSQFNTETTEVKSKDANLCWDEELEHCYNFCAWNILAHNIWYSNEDDRCNVENYKSEELDRLILKENPSRDEYKIQLNKHPFFFLFCLVDTIEPFKNLNNISELKKVSIEIIDKSKIKISSTLKCGCNETILKQVEYLNKWLTKTTKRDEENVVTINLINND
jgi:hypothetical protein